MKKFLPLPLFYLLATITMGQGYIGPSPDATAVMRQVNIGVSHYTGTPNISIPLAELSGRELGVSASLSYNSFGHRVQDVASSEGLGWSLSAGGMITRVVRGEPDDEANGFCSPDPTDTEPDLFIFSFMGRSGKFVLNSSGYAVLFPYQDLKIVAGICGTGETWVIIDENGTRYQFGNSLDSREKTFYRPAGASMEKSHTSTWHLSKVISTNGTDEIDFLYTPSSVTYVNYYYTKEDGPCSTGNSQRNESMQMRVGTKYIRSIETSGGTMEFLWNNYREDLEGAKSLAEIKVRNSENHQVRKLSFGYGYFQSGACTGDHCERLKLEHIYDLSPEPLYSFDYNVTENLPARTSASIDYMGLYNAYTGNLWIPYYSTTYGGASRAPDAIRMQANLLTRINNRGGAYSSFLYQPHQGFFGEEYHEVISGNRIYAVANGDGTGNIQRKYFKYVKEGTAQSSGQLFRKPVWGVVVNHLNYFRLLKRFSHSYNDMFDVNGTHVGYSSVEEEIEGKGKTIHTFTNYDQYPDLAPNGLPESGSPPFVSTTSRFWERGNPTSVTIKDLLGNTIFRDTFEYTFIHPIKSQVSATKSMALENCEEPAIVSGGYTVVSRPFTLKKKTSEIYGQGGGGNGGKTTAVEEYEYDPVTYQLVKATKWNAELPSEKYETIYKYVTHQDYNRAQTCLNNYNQCLQNCGEVPGPCAENCYTAYSNCLTQTISDFRARTILSLKGKHSHNAMVEQQQWINRNGMRTFLGAALNLYMFSGTNGDLIVPASVWASKKVAGTYTGSNINSSGVFVQPSSFSLSRSFETYDSAARLIQETGRDGTVSRYTWVDNHTLPGSVTVNPGTYGQSTSYVYRPLVGVVKETDTNNRSAFTEYDHNGRVRLVKDNEGNIRERYRYHYKNESAGIRIKASTDQTLWGQPVDFTLEDIVLPTGGTPGFAWDMGNGTVYDDNRQNVSQPYASAGLYTVKVVLFTNEYEPYTATKDILVYNPLSIYVCADGPQRVDLCYQDPVIYGSCTTGNNQPTSPTVFHANFSTLVSKGCIGMYTYQWEYKKSTVSTWITINSLGSTATFPPQYQTGTYQIRCTVTDACGNTVTASSYVELYKSNSLC